MAIPNTEINIMSVPFNHTQQNVFSFSSITQRDAYFKGKVIATFLKNMVVKDDSVRINVNFEDIAKGNYIRYSNKNKWYYGFIDEIIYVGEGVTDVRFTIDAWVTYYFDMEVKKSFVEREHVTNDAVGLHLVSEPFNYPKYPISSGEALQGYIHHYLAVTFTGDSQAEGISQDEKDDIRAGIVTRVVGHNRGRATGGITKIYTINQMGLSALLRDVNKLQDKGANTITQMVEVPSTYITKEYNENLNGGGKDGVNINSLAPIGYTTVADSISELQSKLGYTVRNKKLLSDQFFHWELTNNGGGSLETYPSETNYQAPDYHVTINGGQNIFAVARVDNLVVGREITHLTSSQFDSVSWSGSTYAEYLAQNQNTRTLDMGKNALNTVVGVGSAVATGNVLGGIGAVVGGITNVLDTQAREKDIQSRSIGNRGTQTATGLSTILANKFIWWGYGLNKYDLKRADDFLDRYGYQVNTFKVPNMTTRSGFNYVKTSECNITGNIPSHHLNQIITMFNNGFTIWHNQNVRKLSARMITNIDEIENEYKHYLDYSSNRVKEGEKR